MTWERLEEAGADLLRRLGPTALRAVTEHAMAGWPREAILRQTSGAEPLLDALAGTDQSAALAYLTGLTAGYAQRAGEVSVETVWSGPASHHVPVRATAAVLADLVGEARHELLLMTYSARPHPPLTDALRAAIGRGVTISAVVETLQGAGSALSGDEPYHAFTGINGIELWHWPTTRRTEPGAKMHAKLAVADRHILLITSANLTQSGVSNNIEAGLLIRGGTAPVRAAEHVDALRANGDLIRLS
jgi:phosphatidylserine/phosphatidylglycerophosphate/cardiolipin synthase-like enzyme